jgi:hypothetical protein
VAGVAFAAHLVTPLDPVVLAVAGLAVLGALALQATGIRAALGRLRSTINEGAEERTQRTGAPARPQTAYPVPAASSTSA